LCYKKDIAKTVYPQWHNNNQQLLFCNFAQPTMTSKRRRLAIPSTLKDLEEQEDSYQNPNNDFWFAALTERVPRPLPSTQIMIASLNNTTNSTNSNNSDNNTGGETSCTLSPILKGFFQAVGIDNNTLLPTAVEESAEQIDDSDKQQAAPIEPIDDPSSAILTPGHHERYLHLTSPLQTNRRTHQERIELRKLTTMIQKEQEAYQQALLQFYQSHSDRFLVGFQQTMDVVVGQRQQQQRAATFARLASFHNQSKNDYYKALTTPPLITKFGSCRQVISLPTNVSKRPWLDVKSIHFETVYKTSDTNVARLVDFPSIPTPILSTTSTMSRSTSTTATRQAPLLLRDDETAKQLAIQHSATILTTLESLERLLQLPGENGTQWMMYASSVNTTREGSGTGTNLTIVDLPIALPFVSPRQCLTSGFQLGLYQSMTMGGGSGNGSENSSETTAELQYTYTIWTLPQGPTSRRGSSSSSIKVLVRSTICLLDATERPVSIRARVEYFPHRGKELATSYEKALWILDQLISQHLAITKTARICPHTCQVLEWIDTSVALAFGDQDAAAVTAGVVVDPMMHWQALIQLLQAIPMIAPKSGGSGGGGSGSDYILCLPGRLDETTTMNSSNQASSSKAAASVSVHMQADAAANTPPTLDLDSIFPQAGSVLLTADAVRKCYPRGWKWETSNQIPYTFPPTRRISSSKSD
jgi:hypothetical protein